jgi:hypothetical protein
MGVYRRGDVWWFKFRFQGQVIRESAKTNSKALAREAERSRRWELENDQQNPETGPLFAMAAKERPATSASRLVL